MHLLFILKVVTMICIVFDNRTSYTFLYLMLHLMFNNIEGFILQYSLKGTPEGCPQWAAK